MCVCVCGGGGGGGGGVVVEGKPVILPLRVDLFSADTILIKFSYLNIYHCPLRG